MTSDSTPRQPSHEELTHNMILPVLAMAAIGLVVITFLIFLAARWQDDTVADRSLRLAATMLNEVGKNLVRTAADYARREDVLAHLVDGNDAGWGDRHVGARVAETHGYDWALLVEDATTVIAWQAGARARPEIATEAARGLAGLIARARAVGANDAIFSLARIGDQVHVAAAALMVAEDGARHPVLVFTRAIDRGFLDRLSETSGLVDVRLVTGDEPDATMPLRAIDGTTLGGIAWGVQQPGQGVFRKALALILLATPAMIGLSWVFVRRARDATMLLIQRERALDRERERAQRYLTIVGSIIVALDRVGRITLINDAGCRVLGRDRQSLLGSDWVGEAVSERAREKVREMLEAMVAGTSTAIDRAEYEIVGAGGERRLVAWQNTTIRDESGAVDGILSSGDDITERRRIEARAREQQAELAHFLRLGTVGEMATGLAHELNQPLAAIRNFAQGCARRLRSGNAKPEELLQAIEQVDDQATRAGEIINRIRGFIRKRAPEPSAFDVNRAVADVAEMLTHDMRRAGAELKLELAEDLPPGEADRIQIEQVILNLLRNGLDALEDDREKELLIRTARYGDHQVVVSVHDSGRGIAPESLDNLFEPFYTTKTEGLGMGLSISRSIIEAHDGKLWAESEPGTGSVFRFTLPAATTGEEADNGHRE